MAAPKKILKSGNSPAARPKGATKARTAKMPRSKSKPSLGSRMIDAIRKVVEVMDSGEPLEKHFRVHTLKTATLNIPPTHRYTAAEIKAVREKLEASQALLAKFLGVSTHTVSLWEQGKQNAPPIACRYLDDLRDFPELWTSRLTVIDALTPSSGRRR